MATKTKGPAWAEFKGVTITLDDGGQFCATINGAVTRKPSLDTIRAAIKEGQQTPFVPFSILVEHRDKDGRYQSVQVVGYHKGTKNKYDDPYFINKAGERLTYAQAIDTPANRTALQSWREYQDESARIKAEREAGERLLREKVAFVSPVNFKGS